MYVTKRWGLTKIASIVRDRRFYQISATPLRDKAHGPGCPEHALKHNDNTDDSEWFFHSIMWNG